MRGHTIFIAAILCSAGAAAAETPPICADRPGKATSGCTVPAGHWQVETGLADWTLQKSGGDRDTSLAIGETMVKYGLTDRSDIEVEVTPWLRETSRADGIQGSASGFGDLAIIYKHQLTSSDAPVQVTAYPFVKIPTSKHSLGNGKWEGGLKLPIGYAIPKSPFSLNLTPELDWIADADGHGHHAAMVQVASLGWQATPKLDLSAEIWGQWDWDLSGTGKQVSADGSVAYLLSNDVQLDAGANFGLNRRTPDVEFYAGVSKRF
jgi:Putative MetA-pathway of phenol degradation